MGRALKLSDEVGSLVSVASASPSAASLTKVNETLTPSRSEISPRGWNVAAFRRSFPEQWAEYLRGEYRTAYAVWKAFPGIDKSTAADWINGKRDPKASVVIAECKRNENAFEILGRDA